MSSASPALAAGIAAGLSGVCLVLAARDGSLRAAARRRARPAPRGGALAGREVLSPLVDARRWSSMPRPVRVASSLALLAVAAAAGGAFLGGIGAIAGIAAVVGAHLALPPALLRRDAQQRQRDLPVVLDAVARALRSGASVRQALRDAPAGSSPTLRGDELATVAAAVEAGVPLPAALRSWRDTHPDPATRFVAAALALGAASGTLDARSVESVAGTVRTRLDAAADTRALASQAQASAVVLVAAPVAFLAVVSVADPAVAAVVTSTPLGWACVTIGLALDGAAALVMRRIVRSVG